MARDVIMPALGLAQETGKIVRWLKAAGEMVAKGEPIMEIETDKITVEIEAPAAGILDDLRAAVGHDVPVGHVVAVIRALDDSPAPATAAPVAANDDAGEIGPRNVYSSPVAARMVAEHGLDLARIKPQGGRVEKADVVAYLADQPAAAVARLSPASPKARRLAAERELDLRAVVGTGPGGAVLYADVLAFDDERGTGTIYRAPTNDDQSEQRRIDTAPSFFVPRPSSDRATSTISTAWRVVAERTAQSWSSVPHFYLVREVDAGRLQQWRAAARSRSPEKLSVTDLLVKLVALALRDHPRLNASWQNGTIQHNPAINIGLAVAIEDGLLVPVIHGADGLRLREIAARRNEIVGRAQAGKLRPDDLRDGTFTISNLGMYNVDAFNAIVNPPNAAILAVGRIADRVVPLDGQPAVRPTMVLTLSCDHRVVSGVHGAQFLDALANLIEEPLRAVE